MLRSRDAILVPAVLSVLAAHCSSNGGTNAPPSNDASLPTDLVIIPDKVEVADGGEVLDGGAPADGGGERDGGTPMDLPPSGEGGTPPPDAPVSSGDRWTIFVYAHADHNLSANLDTDLEEMARATLSPNMNVIVMADYDSSMQRARGGNFPAGTEWLRVRGGTMPAERLRMEPERDLDDPAVLRAAVREVFTQYPADHRAVVMWDHGGGWSGGFGGDTQNGTRMDASGSAIGPLATAIREGLTEAGVTAPRPLDFVAFDTCLLGSVESLHAFRDLAQVYFGAAEIDYGDGWDYTGALSYISRNPTLPMTMLAAEEVRLWDAHHSAGAADRLLRSHVAVDLSRYPALVSATRALADALLNESSTTAVSVARSAWRARPVMGIQLNGNPEANPDFRDLGQFLSDITVTPSITSLAMQTRSAINAMVIGRSQGVLREAVGQLGVHIALPLPDDYTDTTSANYLMRAGDWARATRWDEVLRRLRPGSAPAIGVTADPMNFDNPTTAMLPYLDATVTGVAAQASLIISRAVPNMANRWVEYETAARATLNGPGSAELAWDGRLTTIEADGRAPQPVTVNVYASGGLIMGEMRPDLNVIPGTCVYSNGTDKCQLLYLSNESTASLMLVWENDKATAWQIRDLVAEYPNVRFRPELRVVNERDEAQDPIDGAVLTLPADGTVDVFSEPAAVGSYVLTAQVQDVYGRSASAHQGLNLTRVIR